MTFEEVVSEAHDLGLYVHDCFETKDGWQARLFQQDDCGGAAFGSGGTATAALFEALLFHQRSAKRAPPVVVKPAALPPDIDELL